MKKCNLLVKELLEATFGEMVEDFDGNVSDITEFATSLSLGATFIANDLIEKHFEGDDHNQLKTFLRTQLDAILDGEWEDEDEGPTRH